MKNKILLVNIILLTLFFSLAYADNVLNKETEKTMIEIVKGMYEPEDLTVDGNIVSLYLDGFPTSSEADRLDDLDDRIKINLFLDDYPTSDEVDNINRISQGGRLLLRNQYTPIGYPSSDEVNDLNKLNSNFSIMILNSYYPDYNDVDTINGLDRGIKITITSTSYPDDIDSDNLNDLNSSHNIRLNLDGYPTAGYYVTEINDINRNIDLQMYDNYVVPSYMLYLINDIDNRHNLENEILYYPESYEVDVLDDYDDDITLYIVNYNWPNDYYSDRLKDLNSRHRLEIYGDTYPDSDDIGELNDIGRPLDANIILYSYPSSSNVSDLNTLRSDSHIEVVVNNYFTSSEMNTLLTLTHEYDLSIYESVFPSSTQVADLNEYMSKRFALINNAQLISNTIPDRALANDSFNVTITFKNTGSTTWKSADGYKLGAVGDSDPFGNGRVALPNDVAAGAEVSFTILFKIPNQEDSYVTDWRMLRENVEWFGDKLTKNVEVLYNKRFTFSSGSEAWHTVTYPSVLSPTTFSVTNGALVITANNNVDNFGLWQSPFTYGVVGPIPIKEGLMYRAKFNVSTNIQYQSQVPQTRVRWGDTNGQLNGIMAISSIAGSESSPTVSGKDYEFYFSLNHHNFTADPNYNYMVAAFEMLNFLADDSTNGSIYLNQIDITGFFPTELSNLQEVKRYTFTSGYEGWQFYSQTPFTAPVGSWENTNGCIVLTAQDNTNTFGYFLSPFDLLIEANKLYRIKFTIRNYTSLIDQTPTYRFRVSSQNGQIGAVTSISSIAGSQAVADSNGKTYEVYIDPPQSAIGSSYPNLVFSFDILNFLTDDDPNGSVGLDEVIIEKFDRPVL